MVIKQLKQPLFFQTTLLLRSYAAACWNLGMLFHVEVTGHFSNLGLSAFLITVYSFLKQNSKSSECVPTSLLIRQCDHSKISHQSKLLAAAVS